MGRLLTLLRVILLGRHSSGFLAVCRREHRTLTRVKAFEASITDGNEVKISSVEGAARNWMERIADREGRDHGTGAYTVVRCEANFDNDEDMKWGYWGLEDFHLQRLASSFRLLLRHRGVCSEDDFDELKQKTRIVADTLLREAKHLEAPVLMLTILWTPTPGELEISPTLSPRVRGHVAVANVSDKLSEPITACLALPTEPTGEALALLPSRQKRSCEVGPSAKISAWCTSRRPLEGVRFKPQGVGEVLLVRKRADVGGEFDFIASLEVLEGLVSNIFVIYADGTVRTACTNSVLSGYARGVVLQSISSCPGLRAVETAATLSDAREGMWNEVFVSSAIRLIVPVRKVILPPMNDSDCGRCLWNNEDKSQDMTRTIFDAIKSSKARFIHPAAL
mmetsp:Transcript_26345/g.59398  ORF Transcript_26345/g.59398 Transcript_26345/m.59398 type:complete len:394 (+) Transcript_26345:37-1218(+)